MAVQTSDLLSPVGRLQPAVLWPGLSSSKVEEKLAGFLQAAADDEDIADLSTTALQDKVTKLWVERRAKQEVLDELVMSPSQAAFNDEGSGGYSSEQLRALQAQVDALTTEIDGLIEDDTADEEGAYAVTQGLR